MNTIASGRPRQHTVAPVRSAPPAVAMLRAEWTKLFTLPSTGWLLLGTVALTVALSALATSTVSTDQCGGPGAECPADLPKLSLTGVWLGQAVVVVLAALTVTNEYGNRMIATTLAANPRRVTVLLTKAAMVTLPVLGAGLVAVAGSLLAAWQILPGLGFTADSGYPYLSLTTGPTLRAGAGTVLYLGLIALLSVGIGAIVRDTAGTITAVLGLLYAFPLVAGLVSDPQWRERLDRLGPATAGQAIQATVGLADLPIGPWQGLGVLACWAAGAMLAGALLFRFRDA